MTASPLVMTEQIEGIDAKPRVLEVEDDRFMRGLNGRDLGKREYLDLEAWLKME